jgi:DNA repair protein RadC
VKNIKELSLSMRPRELLLNKKPQAISDRDLWAVLIGNGSKIGNVRQISSKLALKADEILTISLQELMTIPGIGKGKALSIIAAREIFRRLISKSTATNELRIVNSNLAAKLFINITEKKKEYAVGAFLDARKKLIAKKVISIGTLNTSIIHPRDLFSEAILRSAAFVILAHNHPSGMIVPSNEDLVVTKDMIKAGNILGIPFIDHLIVTKNTWRSIINGKSGKIL